MQVFNASIERHISPLVDLEKLDPFVVRTECIMIAKAESKSEELYQFMQELTVLLIASFNLRCVLLKHL